ncbi:hypothetical protein E1176_05475 [Fulvivirga sp. RKSG066]|uniref:hypothetical protein n=1 Tax=Fulvivirga aurantia TaxID=2529383 RepID=UPI0012BBCE8C|nr:hypothetical protein [Fulvivirga aurantia]MTI20466.1 hypothetical protein [Fulvivirga aurantia]
MKKVLFFLIVLVVVSHSTLAQKRSDQNPVTYEELYDEPYAINTLFVQFQPIYGELYTANINAGFGLEATYFLKDKMRFNAQARQAYTRKFDLSRDIAENIKDEENSGLTLEPASFNYYQVGATYHIKDFEESSKTKMFLYKKSYKGDKWASRVPLNTDVPCKVRKIYGARLGGFYFDTSFDLNRVMEAQGKTLQDLEGPNGMTLPTTKPNNSEENFQAYSNMAVGGIYVGGSMSWIKNIAVDFDNKYQEGVDDLILTTYLDILIAPSINVDDVTFQGNTYSSDAVDTSIIGFRAGLEGRFNRTWSWAYGGEIGMRPGLQKRGFYALLKISFPVFSTNLDYSVEAFGR